MKLFGQIVRTAVNTALLPVAVAQDVYSTFVAGEPGLDATRDALERLKDEALEDDED